MFKFVVDLIGNDNRIFGDCWLLSYLQHLIVSNLLTSTGIDLAKSILNCDKYSAWLFDERLSKYFVPSSVKENWPIASSENLK